MKLLVEPVALVEIENAVTSRGIGAESTNLSWNHPLGSYKHDRCTLNRSKRALTPTGTSGKYFSTQRQESRAGLGEYIERILYASEGPMLTLSSLTHSSIAL